MFKISIFVWMVGNLGNIEVIVNQWIESSEKDYNSMKKVYKSNDFSLALYLGQHVIEKLLNAYYVKVHRNHTIDIHNLVRLAHEIEPNLPDNIEEDLKGISLFNLSLHCDNYKQEFTKLCTLEFSEIWINKIENLRNWILPKLK